jgi:hypothetical protein
MLKLVQTKVTHAPKRPSVLDTGRAYFGAAMV